MQITHVNTVHLFDLVAIRLNSKDKGSSSIINTWGTHHNKMLPFFRVLQKNYCQLKDLMEKIPCSYGTPRFFNTT
jgi:hypothetical protein